MGPRQSEGLMNNYGSIDIQNEDETVPFAAPSEQPPVKKRCSNQKAAVATSVIALVVVSLGLLRFGGTGGLSARYSPGRNDDSTSSFYGASPISMGLVSTDRQDDAAPSEIWGDIKGPFPTNSWYLVRIEEVVAVVA